MLAKFRRFYLQFKTIVGRWICEKFLEKMCLHCVDSFPTRIEYRIAACWKKRERRQNLHTHAHWIIKTSVHAKLASGNNFSGCCCCCRCEHTEFNRHTKHFAISCGHKNHFNWLNFHLFLLFFLLLLFTENCFRRMGEVVLCFHGE